MIFRAAILCLIVLLVPGSAILADETIGKPLKSVSGQNFLVSAPTEELAREVLNRAEELRRDIAREWLGKELPPSIGHTVVDVFVSKTEHHGLTSPSRDMKRPSFMMWLTTTPQEAVGPLLAHEVTHVVLLARYPGQVVPWVDEGIACRYDDQESKLVRRDLINWFRETGNWPSLASILDADRILARDHAAFAVSSSMVEFLLTRGTKAQLLAFAVDGHKRGWDAALRSHYSFADVSALERSWQAWVSRQLVEPVGG
jgi:hypothetical protein